MKDVEIGTQKNKSGPIYGPATTTHRERNSVSLCVYLRVCVSKYNNNSTIIPREKEKRRRGNKEKKKRSKSLKEKIRG